METSLFKFCIYLIFGGLLFLISTTSSLEKSTLTTEKPSEDQQDNVKESSTILAPVELPEGPTKATQQKGIIGRLLAKSHEKNKEKDQLIKQKMSDLTPEEKSNRGHYSRKDERYHYFDPDNWENDAYAYIFW